MKRGIVIRGLGTSPDFLSEDSLPTSLADYQEAFATAAAHRFDGVQPYLQLDHGYLSLTTSKAELRRVARSAQDAGLQLPSLEIAPLQYSLVSDDAAARSHGEDVVRRAIEIASTLGCHGVLVIPGAVGLPWEPLGGPRIDYASAYQRLVESLVKLAHDAESARVSIYIENIWNMFLLSPLELQQLLVEVNSGHVGALLDVGNMTLSGFADQWVDILGPYLREVHLKDFRRSVGTVDGFVPLLAGDVDWLRLMEALHRNTFEGYLIAETFPYQSLGHVSLQHTVVAMDALFACAAALEEQ